jgi:hypothetical protein
MASDMGKHWIQLPGHELQRLAALGNRRSSFLNTRPSSSKHHSFSIQEIHPGYLELLQ